MDIHRLRLQAVAPGTRGLFYRHGLAGSDHRSARAGANTFRYGALRARCAHPLAHPSAWPDARSDFRFRPGSGVGRQGCAKSVPATWSGFRPAKSIGTAQVRIPSWSMSPCRKRSTASTSNGWSR